VQRRLQEYQAQLSANQGKFDPQAALKLFQRLPLKRLRLLKAEGRLPPDLEQSIDAIRHVLIHHAQERTYGEFANDMVAIIVTGSGAFPEGAEYKGLDSDIDFTFLLKPGTPDERRRQIEADFIKGFKSSTGKEPRDFIDSNGFADIHNPFYPPEELAKLTEQSAENAERYLTTGGLRFLRYLNRNGGRLKQLLAGKLVEVDLNTNAQLFGDNALEPWMAADIALDQFTFIERYKQEVARGTVSQQKFLAVQAKYLLRTLFAVNLLYEDGRRLQNELDIHSAQAAGGVHAAITKIAQRLGKYSVTELILFEEWKLLKAGKAPSEVFRTTRADLALAEAIKAHQLEAEAFQAQALRLSIAESIRALREVEQNYLEIYETDERQARSLRIQRAQMIIGQAWAISRLDQPARVYLEELGDSSASYVHFRDIPLTIQKDVIRWGAYLKARPSPRDFERPLVDEQTTQPSPSPP
jgi:hypothetical protein